MTRYRDDMDAGEIAKLMDEVRALENAYARAVEADDRRYREWLATRRFEVEDEEPSDVQALRRAALDHRGMP